MLQRTLFGGVVSRAPACKTRLDTLNRVRTEIERQSPARAPSPVEAAWMDVLHAESPAADDEAWAATLARAESAAWVAFYTYLGCSGQIPDSAFSDGFYSG